MKDYKRVLEALETQEENSWLVIDALVSDIQLNPDGTVIRKEFDRCRLWLENNGYSLTTGYLRSLWQTGMAFPPDQRKWKVSVRGYVECARVKTSASQRAMWLAEAEAKGLKLRELSQLVTGKEWADSPRERVKAAMRDNPELITEALSADPQGAAAVASAMETDPNFTEKVMRKLPARIRRAAANHAFLIDNEEQIAAGDRLRGHPMPVPMHDFGARGTFVWVETVRRALGPLHEALYQHQVDHIQLDADHREILLGILSQIEAATAKLRMAADGTVTDAEIAAFLAAQ